MSQTIGMISLGCAKNQINAEQMLFLLRVAGYEILPDPDGADLVIINTCGFIEDAKTEAIDNILAMGELKKEGRVGKILVTGCLAQRYQMEIVQEMPEVDGVLGTGSYYDIVSAVGKVLSGETVAEFGDINANLPEPQRILTTPEHYAYLRIAEGCDNHCAFCIIPKLRGRYRSRPMEELVKEAQDLAESGVKELIVIAQDTSRYGIDLYGERKLAELLQKLCAIDGIVWVRIHYLYPDEMSDELIDVLADEPKILSLGAYGDGMDFFTLKGGIEAILRACRIKDVRFEACTDNASYHPGRCAKVYAGDVELGLFGQIHPLVAATYGVDAEIYAAELRFDALYSVRGGIPVYQPLPKFPAVTRDIAVVCAESVTVGALEDCIRRGAKGLLKKVELFDIYRGVGVAPGSKSVAFSLTLRADDRSLTGEEADEDVKSILALLEAELGAKLR